MNSRTRFRILNRDNFTCRYCGRSAPQVVLQVDHILARANGGHNHETNLITACVDCNQGKTTAEVKIELPAALPVEEKAQVRAKVPAAVTNGELAEAILDLLKQNPEGLRFRQVKQAIPHVKRHQFKALQYCGRGHGRKLQPGQPWLTRNGRKFTLTGKPIGEKRFQEEYRGGFTQYFAMDCEQFAARYGDARCSCGLCPCCRRARKDLVPKVAFKDAGIEGLDYMTIGTASRTTKGITVDGGNT